MTTTHDERLRRWRLVLGQDAQQACETLGGDDLSMDRVLEALYNPDRSAGLGSSAPNVNRWLGDIRKYFPKSTVRVMQKDALDRLSLQQLLLEPELLETVEPDYLCSLPSNLEILAGLLRPHQHGQQPRGHRQRGDPA